ncbi:hypothetical protein ABZZ44_32550 [Streptomyces sp. NPDC006460]|uniref:hypothetical protein n=1 Tax=Streptomyces sp. NPDC006460 TaxID=3154304 RepID=UPI0033BE94E6
MELRPIAVNRVAHAGLGIVPGVLAVGEGVGATGAADRVTAGVIAALCAVLGVRGYRLGVRCAAGRLTVRGWFWTRTIERHRVTEITGFPAVRWTAPSGRRRWTPVTAFMSDGGELAVVRRSKRDNRAALRRWAAGRGR